MMCLKKEFKLKFGIPDSDTGYGPKDREEYRRLINKIYSKKRLINKMTETINQYTHEPLLEKLVENYNEITIMSDKHMGV